MTMIAMSTPRLLDRRVLVRGLLTRVTAHLGDDLFVDGLSTPVPTSEAVILPSVGESVHLQVGSEYRRGTWLGLRDEQREPISAADSTVLAVLLLQDDGTVAELDVPISEMQATFTVDALAQSEQVELLRIIAGQHRAQREAATKLQDAERRHREWVDDLVSEAHEWADENDLCHRFDDFMEEHNLPPRSHDYKLSVTMRVQVCLTASGRDVEAAIQSLSRSELFDRIDDVDDILDWEAEETY